MSEKFYICSHPGVNLAVYNIILQYMYTKSDRENFFTIEPIYLSTVYASGIVRVKYT